MPQQHVIPFSLIRCGLPVLIPTFLGIAMTARGADDLTKPIHISPDHHFLSQPDGKPFFWMGDWAWELFKNPDHEEADRYLQDRARKGFTIILAPVTGDMHALTRPNRYGDLPLIDSDPARPNPRYFENVDWILDRAMHYGLRFALMPTWGDPVTGGWSGSAKVFTVANAAGYGRWLAARYRHKGVIWILGGDTNPLWPKVLPDNQFGEKNKNGGHIENTIIDYSPIYDALAKGIIEGTGAPTFISYHPTGGSWPGTPRPRTSLYFANRAWLNMNMIQSGHWLDPEIACRKTGLEFVWNATFNYEPIIDEYNSTPIRPVLDGEPRFEDIAINLNPENGYWKAYDSRNGAYHSLFAGAAGLNYGDESLGLFYDPTRGPRLEIEMRPWQQALNATGSGQMQHAKALMLSRPYFTRIPDQTVIIGNVGRGEPHMSATRDRDGSYAMIYLPHGQTVTVDLSKIEGPRVVAWWFDPQTGAATQINGRFPTSGTKAFTPPTSGAETDWVLVVDEEQKRFPAPGAVLR